MKYLTSEQKQFYKENGYILLDNIFSPDEIEECSTAYDELFKLKTSQETNMEATWSGNWQAEGGKRLQSVLNYNYDTTT